METQEKFVNDDTNRRLTKLREQMKQLQIDAYFITRPCHRRYLSGFAADADEDGSLFITQDSQWVVTDFRYIDQVAEEAPSYTLHLVKGPLPAAIAELTARHGVRRLGFESNHAVYSLVEALRAACEVEFVATKDVVESLRLVKDDGEVAKIRRAAAIADEALRIVVDRLKPGLTEAQIAFDLEMAMRSLKSEKNAFPTIVASGVRGALPHGIATDKPISEGELVTIDFGAVYQGYHSDMTRTFAVGEPSSEAVKIYELVKRAQQAGLDAVAANKSERDVDAASRALISDAGYGENFGHGLGHGVGLAIHEGPRLSPRAESALCANMVVTIEPGIYISGWGGIRIEDLVVVTETGCEVLSTFSKDLTVV